MDIEQVVDIKRRLETDIRKLLNKFLDETGAIPSGISLDITDVTEMGSSPTKIMSKVTVGVEI